MPWGVVKYEIEDGATAESFYMLICDFFALKKKWDEYAGNMQVEFCF